MVAEALGKPEAGDKLVAQTERDIAETRELYADYSDLGALYLRYTGAQGADLEVFGEETNEVRALRAFGLQESPALAELSLSEDIAPTKRKLVPIDRVRGLPSDIVIASVPDSQRIDRTSRQQVQHDARANQRQHDPHSRQGRGIRAPGKLTPQPQLGGEEPDPRDRARALFCTPAAMSGVSVPSGTAAPGRSRAQSRALRPDIQALRAIAVVLVVLNHLWPTRLPGGYVGVDVFFVVSGFLISAHLLRGRSSAPGECGSVRSMRAAPAGCFLPPTSSRSCPSSERSRSCRSPSGARPSPRRSPPPPDLPQLTPRREVSRLLGEQRHLDGRSARTCRSRSRNSSTSSGPSC